MAMADVLKTIWSSSHYFAWFLVLVPFIGLVEMTLLDLATDSNTPK